MIAAWTRSLLRRTRDGWVDRFIERELVEGLPPRDRQRLHDRLRRDPVARARYDRAADGLRVLEGEPVLADGELDMVGRWLADTLGAEASEASTADVPARSWWPALASLAAVALVLLWARPMMTPGAWQVLADRDDGWQARGPGNGGALGLEVLCLAEPSPKDPRPSPRRRDCAKRDLMGFAYRTQPGLSGTLTLFGVDAEGDPMYYLPTPIDPSTATVRSGSWQALPMAVRLSVNHAPGPLRVYGLVSPVAPTAQEVAQWARVLAPLPAATVGDASWSERVPADTLRRVCPSAADCFAAELRLVVEP